MSTPRLRSNADSGIKPLEGVVAVSPAPQPWIASLKHISRRVLFALLGPDAVFVGILLVCFALLAAWGILHHAMWRDELVAWLVAVDSRSLVELFNNLRLDAHPYLWHLLLYCLSRFTSNPIAMQLLHLGLAVTTIWMFLRFSPFRRIEKTLFIFGYFPFYEYCVISRNYLLVVLFLFLLCTLLQNRSGRYIPVALVLFGLTTTHVYGFVLALAFFVFLVGEHFSRALSASRDPQPRWKLPSALLVTVFGFALVLWKCLLVPASIWQNPPTSDRLAQSLITILRAYVPLPCGFPHWPVFGWGSNFLCDNKMAPPIFDLCILSLALAIGTAGLFLDRPKGVFLYGLITLGLLMFQFLFGGGALRQAGFLFMGLIAIFWLSAGTFERRKCSASFESICERIPSWRRTFLMVLLVIHLLAGLYAYSAERTRPFSASRDAAQFLRRQGLAKAPIVASKEIITQGLAAYLERPIYYADSSRWGSHGPFYQVQQAPQEKIIKCAYQLFEKKREAVVVALSYELDVSSKGTTSEVSEMYLDSNGEPYIGANGIRLSPSEVRLVPLPRVKMKKIAQFTQVLTDEPYIIYFLGLELRVDSKAWEIARESVLTSQR